MTLRTFVTREPAKPLNNTLVQILKTKGMEITTRKRPCRIFLTSVIIVCLPLCTHYIYSQGVTFIQAWRNFQQDYNGSALAKNYACSFIQQDWVLIIDNYKYSYCFQHFHFLTASPFTHKKKKGYRLSVHQDIIKKYDLGITVTKKTPLLSSCKKLQGGNAIIL